MKKLVVLGSLLISSLAFGQANIADARTFSIGQVVTVTGVVTNGSELGNIRYMQDATGAIAAFGGSVGSINRYDSITVTGELIEFSGLLEIGNSPTYVNHGPATVIPQPLSIPLTAASETIESQYVVLNNVTFVQSGTFATGNSTVQVTDGVNTLDIRINGSTNIDGTAIPPGTVTIYGLVGQFNANYQVVPRNLLDIVPYVAPDKEINVKINGITTFSGSDKFIGNTASTPLVIENFGINNLTIGAATFSGPDAASFSTTIVAGNVAGNGSQTYAVNFNPTTPGSKFATLTIVNNDPDENPYTINFEGVGTDNLATQPTANPTGLNFNVIEAYKVSGQFTAAAGSPKYLVLWKNGSAPAGTPVDGTTYLRGDVVGDAKVAYVGSANGFTPRGVIANQDYYFKIYAFNGQGGFENYLTTTPLTGNVTSGGEEINNYYNGISTTSPTLIADLTDLINPHQFISYFNYKQTMIAQFEERDTTNGESFVECAYSGERKKFSGNFDWTAQNFSREHVFAHSWFPSNPANNPEKPEYTDQHNLHPVNFNQVNSVRSNYPLGKVVTQTSSYLGGKFGLNAAGQNVYEPRDEMKGNAARALMYMATCYNGESGIWAFPSQISFVIPYGQDAEVIKQWHFDDLPDDYEIARNEYVYSIQNNRNPFVDSVQFACFINFASLSYDADGCNLNVSELLKENFKIYPVPAKNEMFVQVNGANILSYEIMDLNGRIIESKDNLNNVMVQLNTSNFASGSYIIHVNTAHGDVQKTVIVE
jgi:endonuclease I